MKNCLMFLKKYIPEICMVMVEFSSNMFLKYLCEACLLFEKEAFD